MLFWELSFNDEATVQIADYDVPVVSYDPVQGRLFRVGMLDKVEITGLRPQEHKLVRYMAGRNAGAGDVPALCGFDELMQAIWGDEHESHQQEELTTIVYTLRRKLEPNPRMPQLLLLEPGFGYRLRTSRS